MSDEIKPSDDEIEKHSKKESYCQKCNGWGFIYGGSTAPTAWTKDCPECDGKDVRAYRKFIAKG